MPSATSRRSRFGPSLSSGANTPMANRPHTRCDPLLIHRIAPMFLPRQRGGAPRRRGMLKSNKLSYRDVLIVQLAYRLSSEAALDLTQRHIGARTVGQRLGRFFASQHIRKVQDAYQNIGKNSPVLVRGNFPQFDSFLRWASVDQDTKIAGIEAAFDYACGVVAATSRPVPRMPPLDRSAHTFANVNTRALIRTPGVYCFFRRQIQLSFNIGNRGRRGRESARRLADMLPARDHARQRRRPRCRKMVEGESKWQCSPRAVPTGSTPGSG